MVQLLGKSLNLYKRMVYAIRVYEGVGPAVAKELCDKVYIHPFAKVKDVRDEQIVLLKELLQPMMEQRRQNKLLKMKLAKSKPQPLQPT